MVEISYCGSFVSLCGFLSSVIIAGFILLRTDLNYGFSLFLLFTTDALRSSIFVVRSVLADTWHVVQSHSKRMRFYSIDSDGCGFFF